MNGNDRKSNIIKLLSESKTPISGSKLAKLAGVSRQVIVQDIALLRANGENIISTNQGYLLMERSEAERVFKMQHSDEQTEDELNLIVDYGGTVKDVFIYHKVYGTVKADMNIKKREDVRRYLEDIRCGKSGLLKNVTSGYHYHTVEAPSEAVLDIIMEKLRERGYLAALQDYEPIDFWNEDKG